MHLHFVLIFSILGILPTWYIELLGPGRSFGRLDASAAETCV